MNEVAARVLEGEQASVARVIRWLEDGDARGFEALRALYPKGGRAHLVGITGPPGAGKSTLVDGLVADFRAAGSKVAVVAVDPSSPFSGGALLGDRVRMHRHASDPGVFIRSMATRGRLGGLARTSFDACAVLDAAGYEVVMLETVGVGQDELEVVDLAHTTIVVNVPGFGDEVQALKAGILEVGDIHVLNKADRAGADQTERQLATMLHMRLPSPDGWQTPLLRSVASSGEGIASLAAACNRHRAHIRCCGAWRDKEGQRAERILDGRIGALALERIAASEAAQAMRAELCVAMRRREIDPHAAAEALFQALCDGPQRP